MSGLYEDIQVAESNEMQELPEELRAKRAYLQTFFQENATQLIGIIRSYVVRMRPGPPDVVQNLATEVFQEAVVEALRYAGRLDPTLQPRAWFLAIATNVLRRTQSVSARRYRFEIPVSDLTLFNRVASEADLFDQVAPRFAPGPEQDLEMREQVHELLTLVSAADAEVLCLALLYDLDSTALANRLRVSVGAARVRLHRAQRRLRAAWAKQEAAEKRGKRHA
jgi:RNA polymerase sigma-70 factor (ECF subfamily)